MSAVGGPAVARIRNYEELESRTLLKDLLDYGDRAIREYEPPRPGPSQYVPENHWFFLIRRFVSAGPLFNTSPAIDNSTRQRASL